MTTQTTFPRLTPKFAEALAYVYEKHKDRRRRTLQLKGSSDHMDGHRQFS